MIGARIAGAALLLCLLKPAAAAEQHAYFPPPGQWAARPAAELGFDAARLQSAIDFALAHETRLPRDLELGIALSFAREPFEPLLGPVEPRGGPTGLVIRHGYLVAQWGDPDRVEMTFSVAKSLLSTVVGIAHDRGLIKDLDAPVGKTLPLAEFEGEPNDRITWDQLIRQTSNWRGSLFGRPDWADRPEGDDPLAWPTAPVPAPGEAWEYNDVRVNVLALAAMHAWRSPLPEVLAREVMQPIGASEDWRWEGYRNSWVELDGRPVQSVSGGGHFGGGVFISAWDLARFGLLTLREGRWAGRQVYSRDWHRYATTPTEQNSQYGAMNWFLNHDLKLLPSAPREAFAHLGMGSNLVYVDPVHDLVIVARWIDGKEMNGLVAGVLAAIEPGQ
ncbi:MAG: serine hydrolase domain-containing protein [Steroidobacteraceae bacterium]